MGDAEAIRGAQQEIQCGSRGCVLAAQGAAQATAGRRHPAAAAAARLASKRFEADHPGAAPAPGPACHIPIQPREHCWATAYA